MTRALELTLRTLFDKTCKIFIGSFEGAYVAYGVMSPADFEKNLQAYQRAITDNRDQIYRMAAAEINKYLQSYLIHANQSADEFKLICFLGRAIEKFLKHLGYEELSRVHMFVVIGLMDDRLRQLEISKPTLIKAMTKLIRLNMFHDELGERGFYMIYKCVATTKTAKK